MTTLGQSIVGSALSERYCTGSEPMQQMIKLTMTMTWKHQVGNNMETWKHQVDNNMETSQESSIHSLALKSPISSNFTVFCFKPKWCVFFWLHNVFFWLHSVLFQNLNGVFSFDGLAAISEKLSKHFFVAAQNHGRAPASPLTRSNKAKFLAWSTDQLIKDQLINWSTDQLIKAKIFFQKHVRDQGASLPHIWYS